MAGPEHIYAFTDGSIQKTSSPESPKPNYILEHQSQQMSKYYLPPTVEDVEEESSECCSEGLTPPSNDDPVYAIPRDPSRRASSSTISSTTPFNDQSLDSGSRDKSQPKHRNSIDVDSWNRILQLHEEYKHHRPSRHLLSSPKTPSLGRRSSGSTYSTSYVNFKDT